MRWSTLLVGLIGICACQTADERVIEPAFYHWQTQVAIGDAERALLDSLAVDRLYLKFFDVDWSTTHNAAVPLAPVQAGPTPLPVAELVPTVFITNRTLKNTPPDQLSALAKSISAKLTRLVAQFPAARVVEWQFDCDWTATTRDRYFALLRELNQLTELPLSATIRLHQIADPKGTGIPPVNRGMLMYYNTGELRDWATQNSILEDATAAPYLSRLSDYPLPLDVALPIFRWGVIFHPTGEVHLLNNLTAADIEADTSVQWLGPNRAEVRTGTYLRGRYLSAGDRIRLETISPAELRQAAERLREVSTPDSLRVVFYQLDAMVAERYSVGNFKEVLEVWSH